METQKCHICDVFYRRLGFLNSEAADFYSAAERFSSVIDLLVTLCKRDMLLFTRGGSMSCLHVDAHAHVAISNCYNEDLFWLILYFVGFFLTKNDFAVSASNRCNANKQSNIQNVTFVRHQFDSNADLKQQISLARG